MADKDESLNRGNFKDFARKVIAKYNTIGMVADAMVWNQILGLYDAEIKALEDKVAGKQPES